MDISGLQPGLSAPSPAVRALAPTASPTPRSGFDDILGSIGAGGREATKQVDALEVEGKKIPIPTMDLPPKPKPRSTDPLQAWGSIAMVFAALASLKVRNHASTAMNAAASALNGISQRDADAYNKAFKEWEVETKNAIDLAHFQQDTYKTLMESVQHRENLAIQEGQMFDAATEAKFKTLTVVMGDPHMWEAYRQGGIKGAMDYQDTVRRQTEQFELEKIRLEHQGKDAGDDLLADQIAKTPEFQKLTRLSDKFDMLIKGGVSVMKVLKIQAQLESRQDIAAAANQTREDVAKIGAASRERVADTGAASREDVAKIGAGSREKVADIGAASREKVAAGKLDLGQSRLELDRQRAAFNEKDKDRLFGFRTGEEFDLRKLTAKERADQLRQNELDRINEASQRYKFLYDKLTKDEEYKEEKLAQDAVDHAARITLGEDVLRERAENDVRKADDNVWHWGETHDEREQRLAQQQEGVDEKKDNDAFMHEHYRNRDELAVQQFDERKVQDEQRFKLGEERVKLAEERAAKSNPPLPPDEIERTARAMVDLTMPMASDYLAAKNASWAAANQRAREIAEQEGKKNFSAQLYPTLLKMRQSAASGTAAEGIRFLDVAVDHLQTMEAAIMDLPNDADVRVVARVFNMISNQLNDSHLAGEKIDADIVSNEISKAISKTGLTGAERDKIADMMNAAGGPNKMSLLTVLHEERKLLGGQISGYMKQFNRFADYGVSSAELTGIQPRTAESYFIDPKTGEVDPDLVQKDYARVKELASRKPAAAPNEGAPQSRQTKGGQKAVKDNQGRWWTIDGETVPESDLQ